MQPFHGPNSFLRLWQDIRKLLTRYSHHIPLNPGWFRIGIVDGYFTDLNQCYASEQDTPLYINPNKHVLCKRSQFNVEGMVNTQHTQKQISKLSTKRPGKFCQQINLKIFFLLGALREKKGTRTRLSNTRDPKKTKDLMAGRKIILLFLKGHVWNFRLQLILTYTITSATSHVVSCIFVHLS